MGAGATKGKLRRLIGFCLILLACGAIAFFALTGVNRIDPAELAGLTGDAGRGEQVFNIGGCASCHSAPGANGADLLLLSGGRSFASPFGTFIAPNISPDPDTGIGRWQALDLVNAMKFGTSPGGRHYFPAFPYTSYARVNTADIVDLWAYLSELPAVSRANEPHDLPFPFNIRRSLGGWKLLFLSSEPATAGLDLSDQAKRGRYLVEGLGHCGECHSPRGLLGNIDYSRWLRGGPNPAGKGRIPDLVGLDWSEADIAAYLKTGFTPEFDTAGDAMAEVVENTARLNDQDRAAIAAYLKSLPER